MKEIIKILLIFILKIYLEHLVNRKIKPIHFFMEF